jgi:hypothetical protein
LRTVFGNLSTHSIGIGNGLSSITTGAAFDLSSNTNTGWAMAEGTNVTLGPNYPGGAGPSGINWETYLAQSFNHGATVVNIFGGFQGQGGYIETSTESAQAIAAYQKFLEGRTLVEAP